MTNNLTNKQHNCQPINITNNKAKARTGNNNKLPSRLEKLLPLLTNHQNY
jgi:hypothetical protein